MYIFFFAFCSNFRLFQVIYLMYFNLVSLAFSLLVTFVFFFFPTRLTGFQWVELISFWDTKSLFVFYWMLVYRLYTIKDLNVDNWREVNDNVHKVWSAVKINQQLQLLWEENIESKHHDLFLNWYIFSNKQTVFVCFRIYRNNNF